ncbi:MAG: hypothetical protein AAFU57_15380 [Bacteroidota bacterium]
MKKHWLLLIVFTTLFSVSGNSQFTDYKYIIIPKQFDAYDAQNKHQTSTLIKFLLKQRGFNSVYDDVMPNDLLMNRCLGLEADIEDNSTLFATKVIILFKNCRGEEIFRTMEGRSKAKDFKTGYREALAEAAESLDGMPNEYTGASKSTETLTLNFKDDVKQLSEEKKQEMVVEQKNTTEEQVYKAVEIKDSNLVQETAGNALGVLYAQPTEGGYQLVDNTPQVVFKLVATSLEKVYLLEGNGLNGVVFEKEGQWYLETAEKGKKKSTPLQIKF